MSDAILEGWLYLPLSSIHNLNGLMKELTIKPFMKTDLSGKPNLPIHAFDLVSKEGYIGVPRRYGLSRCSLKIIDNTSCGDRKYTSPREPDLNHPDAHSEQKLIVPVLYETLLKNKSSFLIASTGSGKTVMALAIAAKLRLRTLVTVKSERLKLQWIKEITANLGYTEDQIGLIQGDVFDIDKPFVIAMVQTLYKGKHTERLHNKFGFVINDEIHNLGADEYSKVLGQINATYMLAMTATHKRTDGKDRVYKLHFGDPDVKAEGNALPIRVNVLGYRRLQEPNWGTSRSSKIKCVSLDPKRNLMIARLITKLVNSGRQIVVFSDFKKHLLKIFELCVKQGCDSTVFGHYYLGGELLQQTAKLSGLTRTQYLDHVQNKSQVILSIYSMMKEGISINRLDAGLDATPQSKATQIIGRIRRPYVDKKLPLWFTIHDLDDDTLSRYTKERIKEYKADKTVELVRFDEL